MAVLGSITAHVHGYCCAGQHGPRRKLCFKMGNVRVHPALPPHDRSLDLMLTCNLPMGATAQKCPFANTQSSQRVQFAQCS